MLTDILGGRAWPMQGSQATKCPGSPGHTTLLLVEQPSWQARAEAPVVPGHFWSWRTRNSCGYFWLLFLGRGPEGQGSLLLFTH